MNGTGADYDQEAVVLALEDGFRLQACVADKLSGPAGDGEIIGENRRRDERINPGDAEVIGFVGRHGEEVGGAVVVMQGYLHPVGR